MVTKVATKSNILGETIKDLLGKKGLKAYQLAEKTGTSATSISKIMNGVTRPRQNTFTLMCKVLCEDNADTQRLVSAFAGAELSLPESEENVLTKNAEREVLRLRAEQFLERKAESVQFKRMIEREFQEKKIPFKRDYCKDYVVADFLIEIGNNKVAVECKSNVLRDFDKTAMISELLKEKLELTAIYIVMPFKKPPPDELPESGLIPPPPPYKAVDPEMLMRDLLLMMKGKGVG